jgi:Ca-activated chloride channel homolog
MPRYRFPRLAALAALALGLATTLPAAAIDVFITSPRPQEGVFGEIEVVAEVLSAEPVAEVVFRVDDEQVGRRTSPPWRVRVDLGQDNLPHVFDVTARDVNGDTASARVVTRTIAVDLQLDLELQQLYITVTRGGERLQNLPREAFTVLDEGREQEIVTFETGDVPLTAVLMVDTSVSMQGERLRAALEGAQAFVRSMRELDEAALMLFSDRLLHQTRFSSDPAVVAAGLGGIEAAGGTALNDHLYAALKLLEPQQGRRVVILLSDGTDVESTLGIQDVLWKAQRSQALVYWIRLREAESGHVVSRTSGWRDMEGHRRELEGLGQVVQQSGGRIVDINRIDDATAAFRDVLAELRGQYVIGYYPSRNENDGSWHGVQVRVRGAAAIRTREGYVDF